LSECEYLRLLRFNQLSSPFQSTLLDVNVMKRSLPVHVAELCHHDFQGHSCLCPKCPKCVPQIVEAESLHIAFFDEFSPGFHPCNHRPAQVPLLLRCFGKMPGLAKTKRQEIVIRVTGNQAR
jgi:hypothetical protein